MVNMIDIKNMCEVHVYNALAIVRRKMEKNALKENLIEGVSLQFFQTTID